jgi:hypothetical protein
MGTLIREGKPRSAGQKELNSKAWNSHSQPLDFARAPCLHHARRNAVINPNATQRHPFPNIDPVLISVGPFAIRWYALAYIVGILGGWFYALDRALGGALGRKGAAHCHRL